MPSDWQIPVPPFRNWDVEEKQYPLSYRAKSLLLCWEKPGKIYQKHTNLPLNQSQSKMKKEASYTLLLYFQGDLTFNFFALILRKTWSKHTPIFLCRNIHINSPFSITKEHITLKFHYTTKPSFYQTKFCSTQGYFRLCTCFNDQDNLCDLGN